jgi:hypothetical protein
MAKHAISAQAPARDRFFDRAITSQINDSVIARPDDPRCHRAPFGNSYPRVPQSPSAAGQIAWQAP